MPALTIADLGILRDVRVDASGHVDVDITPTYSGCPALDTIREDVERCMRDQGYADVTVRIVLSPAWTTEWMSEAGRRQAARVRHRAAASARFDVQPLTIAVAVSAVQLVAHATRWRTSARPSARRCASATRCGETFPHFKEH